MFLKKSFDGQRNLGYALHCVCLLDLYTDERVVLGNDLDLPESLK